MEMAMAFRPGLECGMMPAGSRYGVLSKAADRLRFSVYGGRRYLYTADLSSRVYRSAGRDDGFFGKSRLSVGYRFPILSESNLNHWVRRDCLRMVRAEEEESNGAEERAEVVEETPKIVTLGQPITVRKSELLTSPDFWVQVAIFVFTAGFVDAGFSGDWSRIGVLSKQTEEELQMAAVGVVPLAITLIWSLSERRKHL
ncbi:unnamed protein product [Calypogeia fissa]